MTSIEPAEPEKQSIDEFLEENTNATPEELEQAKEEAEEAAERKQRERDAPYDPTDEFED